MAIDNIHNDKGPCSPLTSLYYIYYMVFQDCITNIEDILHKMKESKNLDWIKFLPGQWIFAFIKKHLITTSLFKK